MVSSRIGRRLLLRAGLGGITFGAVAVAAGCSGSASDDDPSAEATPAEQDGGQTADDPATTTSAGGWERVDLSFVSAYVFVRGGQAAVVDTGTNGSEADIQAVLARMDLGWGDVGDVILTHSHGDHIGAARAIGRVAPDAVFHAGEGDVAAIDIGRDVMALRDGDSVFDLSIIATPGHTPGHVCVYDIRNSVLVTGDALTGRGGGVELPVRDFTADYDEALRSVEYLGSLDFATALFGHGEPLMSGASAQVRALQTEG